MEDIESTDFLIPAPALLPVFLNLWVPDEGQILSFLPLVMSEGGGGGSPPPPTGSELLGPTRSKPRAYSRQGVAAHHFLGEFYFHGSLSYAVCSWQVWGRNNSSVLSIPDPHPQAPQNYCFGPEPEK